MKHVLLVLACLVIPSLVLSAPADSSAVEKARPNSLQDGAWAIQFTLDEGLSGGGALVKRHLNPGHAIRAGFEFSLESRSGDFAEDTTSVSTGTGTNENDYFNVSAELLSQHYLNPLALVHAYFAVGPFVSFSEYHDEEVTDRFGEHRTRNSDRDILRVGGKLLFGAEWFATQSLSLAVEYAVRAGYVSIKDEFSSQYEAEAVLHSTQDQSGWFADGGSSRFLLGIYF